MLEYIKRCS